MKEEVRLMKGNDAIAHAAVRYGADGYFGYPITPQSEVLETLEALMPWETTGMVVLQAESEVASINMVYGGAATGKALKTCLVVNVMRGGPGLGTIHPSQSDYFQATRGGGHGDYHFIVLAPATVQEMADFVGLGFDLAFKYHASCRRHSGPDDGESGASSAASPPHGARSDRAVSVGSDGSSLHPQAQYNDHSGA